MRIFYSITGFKDTLMQQLIIKQIITNDDATVSDSGLPSTSAHLEWLTLFICIRWSSRLKTQPF